MAAKKAAKKPAKKAAKKKAAKKKKYVRSHNRRLGPGRHRHRGQFFFSEPIVNEKRPLNAAPFGSMPNFHW